jgi:dihydrofolate reductase
MNAVAKLVASHSLTDTSAWANSRRISGDLAATVRQEQREVIIAGSLSVVRARIAEDLVDDYRLLTFPTLLGSGERLFPTANAPVHFECQAAALNGAAVLTRYGRPRRDGPLVAS